MSDAEEYKLPEGARVNPDGTVEYQLQWPITYKQGNEEKSVEIVTIRRKTMADNRAIAKTRDAGEVMFLVVTRLCDLTEVVANKMDEVDVEAIGDIVEGFTKPGRTNGSEAQAE